MSYKTFFVQKKQLFTDFRFIFSVWMILSVCVVVLKQLTHGVHNNYYIYKYVFWNVWNEIPLYLPQPTHYGDVNHYGPVFGLIIAPFALLPDVLGATLWLVSLAALLFVALRELPLQRWQVAVVCWLLTNSLIIAQINMQFNTATLALIVLSYTYIKKEKDCWAALMIMLGMFVKIYGIVGFAFFFFSKHKSRLIVWSILWAIVLLVLPMFISSPAFILDQYKAWFHELIFKNGNNNMALMQNISVPGMIKKISGHFEWSDLPVFLVAISLFASSYIRKDLFADMGYQLRLLASVLLFVVLFSSGSEPNTYIIALAGVAIWFVIQPRPFTVWDWGLLSFAVVIAGFGPSDLFPRSIYKTYVLPYAIQALPCALVWLRIQWELFHPSKR